MFYYVLDFYDLPPNSSTHLSSFITICEAFLRVQPHFILWLKVLNVKPKVVNDEQADFGGSMVSKLSGAKWPKGTFIDTVKLWLKGWFYITEPCNNGEIAPPAFRNGTPTHLMSSPKKALD